MQERVVQLADEARTVKATSFVTDMVRKGHIMPYQQGEWIARLSRDMKDDEEKRASVSFSKADGTTAQTSSADLTKAIIEGLPKHALFADSSLASVPEGSVLLSTSTTNGKSAYEQGLEFGKAWAERNTPYVPSQNGNGK